MRTLVVIAKEPVPGRVKTRLAPPFTPAEAAGLAEASLRDTLAAVLAAPADRRVLALDGRAGAWLPAGFDVVPQRGDGLGQRLDAAFCDCGDGPALLIGMDTPQVAPELLQAGFEALAGGRDAVLGDAPDGGYWAIGLRHYLGGLFEGVPMSTAETSVVQRRRLQMAGLAVADLPHLRDVDTVEDAIAVAGEAPGSAFAAAFARARSGGLAEAA